MNNVVRTYHFERGIATDGVIDRPVKEVMEGKILDFIKNGLLKNRPMKTTGRV